MKSWILAILLAAVAIAPIFYLVYNAKSGTPKSPSIATVEFKQIRKSTVLEPGAVFDVRACKVVDGYKFGLYLEGDKWIEAHLASATKEEAIPVVIELLNNAEPPPPSVTLLRKVEDYWIVDFELTQSHKRVKLVSILRSKELLLQ